MPPEVPVLDSDGKQMATMRLELPEIQTRPPKHFSNTRCLDAAAQESECMQNLFKRTSTSQPYDAADLNGFDIRTSIGASKIAAIAIAVERIAPGDIVVTTADGVTRKATGKEALAFLGRSGKSFISDKSFVGVDRTGGRYVANQLDAAELHRMGITPGDASQCVPPATPSCTCPIEQIMCRGCTCGALQAEREARG